MGVLEDKIAIVTGAGSGIGKGIAVRFLKEGAIVVGADLYEDRLDQVKQECARYGVYETKFVEAAGDISETPVISDIALRTLQKFRKIDILVNTAGGSLGFGGINFVDSKKEQWDQTIRVNLYTVMSCTKVILPHMIERNFGKIVNFGSSVGMGDSISGGDGQAVYASVKAGIMMFTKAIAREVASYGINVNCITPGLVRTRVTERFRQEVLESVVKKTPFQRIGEVEDIANVALFLVSDEGAWLTGQNICAGGGLVMH